MIFVVFPSLHFDGNCKGMCEHCAVFQRKIERLKELVVQLSDFDEGLVERTISEIAKLRKMKAGLHSDSQ